MKPIYQQLVDRVNAYWLTEYKIDGFRFDFTKGFTNTPGEVPLIPSRIAILNGWLQIWNVKFNAYVILDILRQIVKKRNWPIMV